MISLSLNVTVAQGNNRFESLLSSSSSPPRTEMKNMSMNPIKNFWWTKLYTSLGWVAKLFELVGFPGQKNRFELADDNVDESWQNNQRITKTERMFTQRYRYKAISTVNLKSDGDCITASHLCLNFRPSNVEYLQHVSTFFGNQTPQQFRINFVSHFFGSERRQMVIETETSSRWISFLCFI